ncbi:MAG TPA: L-threonylcarbamoyladenylate synthase [Acidimicrobiia bacterium]|nr:L-threonylcarbamoyladenylate synthase [Acidimicrobiia bacterium]
MPSSDVAAAVEVLRRGGLVAFPTETVYGLGADAANADAVARIYSVKGRPRSHPVIVHLAGATAIKEWAADVPADAWTLAEAFWPGPLTLILPRSASVPDAVTGGSSTVGLRVPDQPLALELLEAFAGGIAAPSANRFGRVSPTTAAHVRADLGADVELVLDGGPCFVGVESTIVDLSQGPARILRLGGLSVDDLSDALGHEVRVVSSPDGRTPAPGTLPSHYAPAARVEVVSVYEVSERARVLLSDKHRVGVLAPTRIDDLPDGVEALPPAGSAAAYAQCLYQRLREADRRGLDVLLAVPPPETGIGAAVTDRLRRAAANR